MFQCVTACTMADGHVNVKLYKGRGEGRTKL